MWLNKKRAIFTQLVMLLSIVLLVTGCAVQQRPEGGPRDKTPPKLIKQEPVTETKNFRAKEIEMEFDEFFKLTNQFQEITITPAMEKPPEYKVRQRRLIIEFKDTLLKNTTYVINFGKAIQDVNENNVLKNFTYVFSTGAQIDSLSISGRVIDNQTQKPEKDVTVLLFTPKQDSLLFGKRKPGFFTTTDSAGLFKLSNLKEGPYKLYALKEATNDKIFNNDNELIAFPDKPIILTKDTSKIELKLFRQVPPTLRFTERKFDSNGAMSFILNKGLSQPKVRLLNATLDAQKIVEYSRAGDTIMVYSKNMDFDSVDVEFSENRIPFDTLTLRKGRRETFTRNIGVGYNFNKGTTVLKPGAQLHFRSNVPIETLDQSLITLREDSNLVDFTLKKDTGNTKGYTVNYRWKPRSQYNMIFEPGAITTIYGDKNKRLVQKFTLDKADNYSNLALKVNVPEENRSYVVELIDGNKNILRSDPITKTTTLNYKGYLASKYTVQVVYDANKNGKWDSGNVKELRQPEKIWTYEKDLTLRPNWDVEESITVPKEPVTP